MTDTALIPAIEVEQTGLTRYQPANLKQLVWFAGEVAKSGMYLKMDASGNQVAMSQAETFMVMSEGIEMGISPITAMRNIYLMEDKRGRKTTIPRADLIAARIQADPRTEEWDVNDEIQGTVTITAKRHNRPAVTITLTLADIPSRDKDRWAKGYLDTQDMLTNRTIRKIARRHFRDMVLGLGIDQDVDDRRVIDVAKVEHLADPDGAPICSTCNHGYMYLQASRTGGVYRRCSNCGVTAQPPQEVRDAVRGTPEHLTLAGAAEPVLEPGERLVESEPILLDSQPMPMPEGLTLTQTVSTAPVSAVQSESERDTLDGEDVAPSVAVPAGTDVLIPEPDGAPTNLQMRSAIYEHWVRPRPTHIKIEMRGLLEEFGWTSGDTLGDWLLGLPDDKLAAIGDALAQYR